jgi:hypothetical protein
MRVYRKVIFLKKILSDIILIFLFVKKQKKLAEETNHACDYCGLPTTKRCARCWKAYYCSEKCQRISYREHKDGCYQVDKSLLSDSKNKAYIEAFECNLFGAHSTLETASKKETLLSYQKARLQIYGAVVSMVLKDPIEGDSLQASETVTPEWLTIHRDFYTNVRRGGEMLYKNGGDRRMRDHIFWSYIPKRFFPMIDVIWDGIGKWKC